MSRSGPSGPGRGPDSASIIYEVVDGQLVILVVGMGHRREIYRVMP